MPAVRANASRSTLVGSPPGQSCWNRGPWGTAYPGFWPCRNQFIIEPAHPPPACWNRFRRESAHPVSRSWLVRPSCWTWTLDGHDTDSSANRIYLDQSQTQPESTEVVTVGTESNPQGPFPSGIEVAVDASPSGASSPQNRCATDIPDDFPEGTSHSGTPQGSGGPGNPGPMDMDTDDRSSMNWTPATQGSADQPALTGTQSLVTMATSLGQTHAPARDTRQGSQVTCQNSDPSQRAGVIGGISTQLWKLHQLSTLCLWVETQQCLQVHLLVFLQCNYSPVWRCPLLAWICNGETWRHRMILFRRDCLRCGRTISTSCNLRSLYPWVSKFLLQHWYRHHKRLFNSQQLRLRVSRPRMLSWWHQPCGRWCRSWFNSNNAWVPFQEAQELQEWDVHQRQLMIRQGFLPHLRWPMFLSGHHWHLLSWDLLRGLEQKNMSICSIWMFSLHSALQIVIHLLLTIISPSSP